MRQWACRIFEGVHGPAATGFRGQPVPYVVVLKPRITLNLIPEHSELDDKACNSLSKTCVPAVAYGWK